MNQIEVCGHCQQPHLTKYGGRACAAHRVNGKPCARPPRHLDAFCVSHPDGVLDAGVQARAAIFHSERAIARVNGQLGPIQGAAVRDPLERLSRLAGQIDSWMTKLAGRVAELTTVGNERGRPHAEIAAMHSSMRLLGELLVAINRLDLDERMIRLDRLQADQLRELLDVVARDPELGLSEEQLREWPRAFARAARHRVLDGDVVDAEEVA